MPCQSCSGDRAAGHTGHCGACNRGPARPTRQYPPPGWCLTASEERASRAERRGLRT
jgi:hypothetical protein